jgi:methionine-S-sulfoxide reductase
MNRKVIPLSLVLVAIALISAFAATPQTKQAPHAQTAVFAGGCFWCMETAFEGKTGVISVISGYAGGVTKNPTYEAVSSGHTGHAESVQVTFDPVKTTYAELLNIFWRNVDPTDSGGQFCDRGTQYRSEIFYRDEAQKQQAQTSKEGITKTKSFTQPNVTAIAPLKEFYPAEEYHQDFYKKNSAHYESYRFGCGRDRRLQQLWGHPGDTPH